MVHDNNKTEVEKIIEEHFFEIQRSNAVYLFIAFGGGTYSVPQVVRIHYRSMVQIMLYALQKFPGIFLQ